MKKVRFDVTETLQYRREITVEVPDEMTESEIETALDRAERESDLDGFAHSLERNGMKLAESLDDDLSSPWDSEIECDGYEFINE